MNLLEIVLSNSSVDAVKLVDPIKIVDLTEKRFDYRFLISTLIAIISTSILIWNQIKRTKVHGKVISKTFSPDATYSYRTAANSEKSLRGQQYMLKLSLSCSRR